MKSGREVWLHTQSMRCQRTTGTSRSRRRLQWRAKWGISKGEQHLTYIRSNLKTWCESRAQTAHTENVEEEVEQQEGTGRAAHEEEHIEHRGHRLPRAPKAPGESIGFGLRLRFRFVFRFGLRLRFRLVFRFWERRGACHSEWRAPAVLRTLFLVPVAHAAPLRVQIEREVRRQRRANAHPVVRRCSARLASSSGGRQRNDPDKGLGLLR